MLALAALKLSLLAVAWGFLLLGRGGLIVSVREKLERRRAQKGAR